MKRLLIALTLTIVTFGLCASDAGAAGGPFHRWRAYGRPVPRPAVRVAPGRRFHVFPTYSRYRSVEDAYPKYIGAFHSRHFQNLGIPPGDVGIRGNSLQMAPW